MERELITLLRRGDQRALQTLFDSYHASLCALACRLINDHERAKDIVQEVFIRLWKNRHQLEIKTSWNAYLKRATVNTALNHIKQASASRNLILEKTNLSSNLTQSSEQEFIYSELKKKADDEIEKLPPRTRTVFKLIRSEEMSYKEVAEVLDISIKAVEKEMMKALKLLREALRDYLPVIAGSIMANF